MKHLYLAFKQTNLFEISVMAAGSLMLCAIVANSFDDSLMILKGCLLVILMVLISYCDAKTHTIPNILLIPVLLTGLIHCNLYSVAGLFVVSIPMWLISKLFRSDELGGGDIKLVAAYGFALGIYGILTACFIGLAIFLLVHLFALFKRSHELYAMAPYFSIGCFFALIFVRR